MTHLEAARPMVAALVLGVLLAPVSLADPPADKGKGAAAAQVPVKGLPADRAHDDGKGKSDDHQGQGRADDNHGQVVSNCNHRANEKKLAGKDRQEYVEWCTDRGERYQYDDRRYDQDRSCYRLAEQKGMSGDARRVFVQNCLERREKNR